MASDGVGPQIVTSSVDATNSYATFEFDVPAYAQGGVALAKEDFSILFTQNGGNATGITSIDNLEASSDGIIYSTPLGGETYYRLHFTITSAPASGIFFVVVWLTLENEKTGR